MVVIQADLAVLTQQLCGNTYASYLCRRNASWRSNSTYTSSRWAVHTIHVPSRPDNQQGWEKHASSLQCSSLGMMHKSPFFPSLLCTSIMMPDNVRMFLKNAVPFIYLNNSSIMLPFTVFALGHLQMSLCKRKLQVYNFT